MKRVFTGERVKADNNLDGNAMKFAKDHTHSPEFYQSDRSKEEVDMKFRTQRSPFPFISLLAVVFLLSAGSAFANPPGSMHGKSKGMHSSSGDYGKSRHEGYGDRSWSSHREGMHKNRGGRHSMHSSGPGMGHKKGHGDHGLGSMHDRAHQIALRFIKHMLKNKEGMSLTDKQVQQLRNLKINYKKDRIRMKADMDIAEVDLHVLLWDEKAKLTDIEAQMNAVHGLMTKLHIASIKAPRDALAVLTDEQRSRMDTMHKRMKSHDGSKGHPGASSKEKKCKKSKGHETAGDKK